MAFPALQVRVPNPANALLRAEQIKGSRAQNQLAQQQVTGRNALLNAFQGGIPTDAAGRSAAVNQVAQSAPLMALDLQQRFSQLNAQDQAKVAREGQMTARALFDVRDQAGWTQALSTLPTEIAQGLPAQYDPRAQQSIVNQARTLEGLFADKRAVAPTPPLSEERQRQELAQIAARKDPATAPAATTSLGKINQDLTNNRITPAQALQLTQRELSPGETWQPMTAEERTSFGIPEGRAAQISSNGKASVIGSSGGITLFDRDGSIMAQVGGQPLTSAQQGTQAIEIADKAREATTRIAELSNVRARLLQTPEATGLSGLGIEKLGGLAEQVTDLVGIDNDWFPTAEVQGVRTDLAALMGQYIPTVTGDESGRYSDQDMRRAEAALPARNPTASFGQVKAALDTLEDVEVRARARALMRGDGFAPGVDLTYNDGRRRYAQQLMDEGKTPEQAAEIIIDLVDKYGIPLTLRGIQ